MTAAPDRPKHSLAVPTSSADQIAQVLEQEILEGSYRRDEHLQQAEICRRFGVSRTPAREALRKLQALSLVELVPNRGAKVRLPTLNELREVYQVRAELEGFAAALAARSRTDDLLAGLSDAQSRLSELVAAMSPGDPPPLEGSPVSEQLRRFNDTFHQLIHSASGNKTLSRMVQDLQKYFPKDTVRLAAPSPKALRRLYLDEHALILDEIARGRPERARDAMRRHIHQSEEMLVEFLRQRGFDE